MKRAIMTGLICGLFCSAVSPLSTGQYHFPGESTVEIETPHFIIRSSRTIEIYALEMAVLSESIYDNVTQFIDYYPEDTVTITLYPPRRTFAIVGYAGEGIVLSSGCPFSTESGGVGYLERKRHIAHEFTHFLLHQKIDAFQDHLVFLNNAWLSEGLAMYVSDTGYNKMRSKAALTALLTQNAVPHTLEEFYETMDTGFLSYSVIAFIMETQGKEHLDIFLSELTQEDEQEEFQVILESAFIQAFNCTKEVFQEKWRAYLPTFVQDYAEPPSQYEIHPFPIINQDNQGLFIGSDWHEDTILCVSSIDHDLNIYAFDTVETRLQRLTSGLGAEFDPKFSPDGTKIAYTARNNDQYAIYCMQADGSNSTRLTEGTSLDIMGSWSPDGKKIAFTSGRRGNYDIFIMNSDGSKVIQLTTSDSHDGWPVFSPEGDEILFVSDRAGSYDLYVMDCQGNQVQQLTHTCEYENYPAFSPDGKHIAFISTDERGSTLHIMKRDGNESACVVPVKWRMEDGPIFSYGIPLWSPRGNSIIFRCGFDFLAVSVAPGWYPLWMGGVLGGLLLIFFIVLKQIYSY